jgi:AcrR family transcriptional regulator
MTSKIKSLTSRKQEILQEAQHLFSKKGYSDASMRDLADMLGVKAASLYSNFDSKETMLWEIAIRCARDFHERLSPIFLSSLPADEKLTQMLEAHIEVIIKNIHASAIFFREWRYLGEARKEIYAISQKEYQERFMEVIRQGIKEGVFRPVKVEFAALTMLSAMNWIHKWYDPNGKMGVEEIKEELVQQVLGGIRK